MKKTLILITFLSLGVILFNSCNNEDTTSVSLRDRTEVYDENIIEIREYLESNYLTFDANNNVTAELIPDGGTQTSIWDTYAENDFNGTGETTVPYIEVKNDTRTSIYTDGKINDPVNYKLYYIKINEGVGETPTQVDSTFVAYKGWNLNNVVFDQNNIGRWFTFPESSMSSISGFRQILREIKTEAIDGSGTTVGTDGVVTHSGYGDIIVFIPSGLAYFGTTLTNISAYSPIAFRIKLFYRKERDHDGDRLLSNYEDFSYDNNGDRIYGIDGDNDFFNDDTNGNDLPDFLDVDDDGDGFLTKFEIRYEPDAVGNPGVYDYYDYSSIPTCSGTLKKHLDPSPDCH